MAKFSFSLGGGDDDVGIGDVGCPLERNGTDVVGGVGGGRVGYGFSGKVGGDIGCGFRGRR